MLFSRSRVRFDHIVCSTGEPDGLPCKVGVAVTDLMTGLYAHGAIMAALRSVSETGHGVWIDCNLFETQVGDIYSLLFAYFIFMPASWLGLPTLLPITSSPEMKPLDTALHILLLCHIKCSRAKMAF